jgi:hypothetical protein
MKHTTLGDLNLYLTHLLQDPAQQALLSSLLSWRIYGDGLREQHAALLKMPPTLISQGKALATELREADAEHDGAYRAIYHLLRAYQELLPKPEAGAGEVDLVGKAQRLQQALVPDLGLTRASYADEAHAVVARQARMQPLNAELDFFPVHGGTLRAWVERLDASAHRLAELLAQRAHKDVDGQLTGGRGEAMQLRSELVGALQDFRTALRAEVKRNPALPADAESRVFQMLDNLAEAREAAHARAVEPAPKA